MSKIQDFSTNIGCENYHDCVGCEYYQACSLKILKIEQYTVTADTVNELKKKFSVSRKQLRIIKQRLKDEKLKS